MRTLSLPLAALIPLAALAAPPPARGLSIPPAYSYKVPSRDRAFDFVMLVPPAAQYDRPAGQALRRTYAKSGLYRAGSTLPLWTVGWYCDHAHIASDGHHLVSLARHHWSPDLPGDLAFYADGQLLRSYSRHLLIDTPSLLPEHTWISSESFDDVAMTFTLETADGNRFVFDLTTGEIASSRRWRRWVGAFAGGMVLLVTAAALGLAFWLRRGKKPSLPPPLPEGRRGRPPGPETVTVRKPPLPGGKGVGGGVTRLHPPPANTGPG